MPDILAHPAAPPPPTESERIVIVGAGQAGVQAALNLRQAGFAGELLLVGDEPHPPYQRPPLSKAFLAGEMEQKRLFFFAPELYAEHNITLRLGERVASIDCKRKLACLRGGDTLPYDRLLLATGAPPRRLSIPGGDLNGIHYLRSLADSLALREALRPGGRMVVVGGGYIGLEIAAVARKTGMGVAVLEAEARILARVAAEETAAFMTRTHESHGVTIHTQAQVARFLGEAGRVTGVVCADESTFPADIAVVGIGAAPAVELAEAAGLAVDNGIVTDEYGRTSDAHIFAAGDVANHPNALLGGRVRLESVQNALEQGGAVGRVMAGGAQPYAALPWFWSDQFDVKLRIAGLSQGHDQTALRGAPESGAFSLFFLREGIITAAECVNAAGDFMAAKRLITQRRSIPPETLADPQTDLKALLRAKP